MYCALFNFGNISYSVGSLWTGLISAWLSLAGSKHNLTFPLGFGMTTKLLYLYAVSSMPSSAMMSCSWSHSNSSLNGFCNAYATHPRGVWYGCYLV